MQKIVIDTNVIVSSLIQKNYPYLIINDFFLEDKFQLCVSDELLTEYYEVLARPKFSKFQDFFIKAESLLANIEAKSIKFKPTIKLDLISDKDDNMVVELADECKADFVITGNTTDFTFSSYNETKIVTPKEYWEIYKPE
jgi:uncharacterized protein